jgi:kumamolisin
MTQSRAVIPGSDKSAPLKARLLGPADPNETAQISIYLKAQRAIDPRTTPAEPVSRRYDTREALRAERSRTLAPVIDRIRAFANAAGLKVVEQDSGRRLMKVEGKLSDLQTAFGAELKQYQTTTATFRGRAGVLTAPSDIADDIEAVLGLDQRPIATPKIRRISPSAAGTSYLPNAVAQLYGFPEVSGQGKGECIAIIELGGGFNAKDTKAAFKAMDLEAPKVLAVAVSGGVNQPGKDTNADGEVALDIQVAGGVAPGATLAVYFTPNTDQGFVDAISQAAHDAGNKPSVMSISWGSAEQSWTLQAIAAMNSALQDAASLGVSVFAASGDNLATDGVDDGKAHVDFPASSPYVVGCGGTRINAQADAITQESVWNSGGAGTGGGVSDLFQIPAYQTSAHLPPSVNGGRQGRGVPDVASDADPQSGYRVVVDSQAEVIGGTSAAAPLWAGLFALVNARNGKPSGQPHAKLYANPEAFRDVTVGNNDVGTIGYKAQPGWDACTGLGAPKGTEIAALFADASA